MSEEELKKYYDIYTECWKFFRKWNEPKTEDEWKQMLCEAEELYKADKDSVLRKRLISETILEINRLAGKREENGKS